METISIKPRGHFFLMHLTDSPDDFGLLLLSSDPRCPR